MKQSRRIAALLLAGAALVSYGRCASADAGDYVRLHVVANSDEAEDQREKLAVRDAALGAAREWLADCESADEAYRKLLENKEKLRRACMGACETGVSIELGRFAFPERSYGDVTLPADEYRALRVVLGEGRGRNWWCVLYPSLCFGEDIEAEESVTFVSCVAQWLRSLFGGEAAA